MGDERETRFYGLVVGAGLITGFRSVSGLAAVSTALERGGWPEGEDPAVAALCRLAPWLRAGALAEMAADKLPMMPNRTDPPILAGRILFGGIAGALLARAFGRNALVGALLAGLAAVAGAFAGLRLRLLTSEALGVPGPVAGLIEDAAVVAGSAAFVDQAGRATEPAPPIVWAQSLIGRA